ncbi:MAG: Jag N-terminal domain-containing protein [Chloroflexi bacterium]|nr:Jag N-terminal domain-containing protein [Chloroflexota bacterium]
MSAERSIEVTGDSVDDAIAKGLAELGAAPTDVIVEVLEEPSRGVFGLGARPAKVRLKVFRSPMPQPAATPSRPQPVSPPTAPVEAADVYIEHEDEDEAIPLLDEMQEIQDEAALDEDARVSKVVLGLLLEKMDIHHADIIIRRAEATRDGETNPWLLDVNGPNLSPLIGRRGETLAALQYITRLIASRELQHRANIVVDVGGYKLKRSRMLRDLALRMADQAIQSKRVVTLEPMPPYERRIIHLTLRNRADVQTKSIGEGNARKVTIVPRLS